MRTCPHLCSGNEKPRAIPPQTRPVNTDAPPAERILTMRLSLSRFLRLDTRTLASSCFQSESEGGNQGLFCFFFNLGIANKQSNNML